MYFVIFVPCYLCLLYGSEINLKVKVKRKRRWGSSLPGLRKPDPPLSPPSTLAETFQCTCLQIHLQKNFPAPQKQYPRFRTPMTTFLGFFLLSTQIRLFWGGRGGPQNDFFVGILIFLGGHHLYMYFFVSFLPSFHPSVRNVRHLLP